MKTHHLFIVISLFAMGCSSNSSLTGSFGNRKYTKGIFYNNPEKIAKPNATETSQLYTMASRPTELNTNPLESVLRKPAVVVKSVKQIVTKKKLTRPMVFVPKQNITIGKTEKISNVALAKDSSEEDKKTLQTSVIIDWALVILSGILLAVVLSVWLGSGYLYAGTVFLLIFITIIAVMSVLVSVKTLIQNSSKLHNAESQQEEVKDTNSPAPVKSADPATQQTQPKKDTKSYIGIAGFVLACIALLLFFPLGLISLFGIADGAIAVAFLISSIIPISAILGLIFGIIGINRPNESSHGLSLASIIVGALVLLLYVAAIIIFV